jgi:two-component system, cell cycle sensor histidine kinase and response regulator CckA
VEELGTLSVGFGAAYHDTVSDLVARGNTGHLLLALDKMGYITGWNSRAPTTLGYEPDDLHGRHVSIVYPRAEAPQAMEHLGYALTYGTSTSEGLRVRKDGSRFWARIAVSPVYDGDDHIGFAKIIWGMRSTTRLQSVLDTVRSGVVTIDSDGVIYSLNKAAESMLGYQECEILEQSIELFMSEARREQLPSDAGTDFRDSISQLLSRGRITSATRRGGSTFPVRVNTSEMEIGGKTYITVVFEDASSQLEIEEQLRQSQKMEEVGLLAGGVAHDFNNLLTVIEGYSAVMLQEMGPDAPYRPEVEAIHQASLRASALTQQLLAFSRKSAMQFRVASLNDLVNDAIKILQRIIGENVHLRCELAPNLEPVEVDAGQLGQVLVNLAVNARDAMRGGGVISFETDNVQMRNTGDPDLPDGDYVRLRVSDTGRGMPPDVLARVFEPFFTTKGEGQGTGLGLSVVHGIVKQCGGMIRVQSTLDVGTVFTVYLPSAAEPADDEEREEASTIETPQGSATILLAEDEDAVRTVAKLILERQGYTVLAAADGEEAIELFAEHKESIAMLVTDIMMPGLGGMAVAESVVKEKPGIPVLFISGYPDDAAIDKDFSSGDVSFLPKPFTPKELSGAVAEALEGA